MAWGGCLVHANGNDLLPVSEVEVTSIFPHFTGEDPEACRS